MHRTLAIISSLAAIVSAIGATGCSSSSSGAPPGCQTAAVSFKTDVLPVFQQSCTISSVCHGQMNNSAEEDLYLGEHMGTTDPNAVYNQLVGVNAKELPTMKLVKADDLQNSFLWHKLQTQDDLTMLASQCMAATMKCTDCTTANPCGTVMPYLETALATQNPAFTCTIQNWIQGGAQNN